MRRLQRDNDEMTMGMPALFEARQAYESKYRRTVLSALTPILGTEDAMSVAVTVDLDPTMIESTVKELDPNTQVTISEQVREEDSKNKTAGGVPGVDANLPEKGLSEGVRNSTPAGIFPIPARNSTCSSPLARSNFTNSDPRRWKYTCPPSADHVGALANSARSRSCPLSKSSR